MMKKSRFKQQYLQADFISKVEDIDGNSDVLCKMYKKLCNSDALCKMHKNYVHYCFMIMI